MEQNKIAPTKISKCLLLLDGEQLYYTTFYVTYKP